MRSLSEALSLSTKVTVAMVEKRMVSEKTLTSFRRKFRALASAIENDFAKPILEVINLPKETQIGIQAEEVCRSIEIQYDQEFGS
jgi:hypothetical protein